ARGDDPLPGLHGNTQIPKVLGCAKLFEVTGDERYRAISERFLELVLTQHTYANGGHGSGEYFGKPGELGGRLSNTNCETCNTVNMLRLARTAFAWEPRSHLADFVERSLI
ncbi:MAG: beta-L-arabinofuranosidase domain-containing protein, partial [Armatimonadaceae bacterium]